MMRPLDYEEYHRIFSDHLMSDAGEFAPTTRVVEVEYYNRETKWFETDTFDVMELCSVNSAIRQVTIS